MQTSQAGKAFIKKNEGFRSRIYNDNGKSAIGYGHDIQGDIPELWEKNGIDEADAEGLLQADVDRVDHGMTGHLPETCTQNQWDSCSDFAYNLGLVRFGTMLAHGWDQVPTQMLRWDHKKNEQGVEVVDPDLTARRQHKQQQQPQPKSHHASSIYEQKRH